MASADVGASKADQSKKMTEVVIETTDDCCDLSSGDVTKECNGKTVTIRLTGKAAKRFCRRMMFGAPGGGGFRGFGRRGFGPWSGPPFDPENFGEDSCGDNDESGDVEDKPRRRCRGRGAGWRRGPWGSMPPFGNESSGEFDTDGSCDRKQKNKDGEEKEDKTEDEQSHDKHSHHGRRKHGHCHGKKHHHRHGGEFDWSPFWPHSYGDIMWAHHDPRLFNWFHPHCGDAQSYNGGFPRGFGHHRGFGHPGFGRPDPRLGPWW